MSKLNGVDVLTLKKTVGAIKENPALARCEFRLKNEWLGGDANKSQAHDFYGTGSEQKHKQVFYFQAGEPAVLAGNDEGANPVEFLLSALAGCITTTIAYYASLNGYAIKKMESWYKGELDLHGIFNLDPKVRPGYQKIHVVFKIQTDAPPKELESYCKFSPVYDVVSKSVPVEIKIETY